MNWPAMTTMPSTILSCFGTDVTDQAEGGRGAGDDIDGGWRFSGRFKQTTTGVVSHGFVMTQ
jgi:hypothetical protein